MKKKTFGILYLERATWTTVNDSKGKRIDFESVAAAKKHIDCLRSEGTHPLCKAHHAVIYGFEGPMMCGEGVRY